MNLGDRLKSLRKEQGITLQTLSDITSLSIGYLSNIERGLSSPTISSLQKICNVLNIDLIELLQPLTESKSIVRKSERREIYYSQESKAKLEAITEGNRKIIGYCITMEPGVNYKDVAGNHPAEELAIVAKGKMEIEVNGIKHILCEGDTIFIESNMSHKYKNCGREECVLYSILIK